MKHFVTLKSATCHHPCLPIHTSIYIHRHHYAHLLKGSGRKAREVKENPLWGQHVSLTWAITALGLSRLDRLTLSLKFFIKQHLYLALLLWGKRWILTQPDNSCFIIPSTVSENTEEKLPTVKPGWLETPWVPD